LKQYQDSPVIQVLARTQVSFATTKGTSDADKSAKIAAGLSITIFDRGDARLDKVFTAKLADKATTVLATFLPLPPTANADTVAKRKKDVEDEVEAETKSIREEQKKLSWNRSSWIIAGAPSWISTDGTTSHLAPNGAAVWSSLAYGFEHVPGLEHNAQLILHGRFHSSEDVPDPLNTGKFFKQQSAVAGARLRFGNENTIGSFETAYIHTRPVGRATDKFFRLTVGAEKRLTDNVWLHLGLGGESGQKNGQNKLFILGAFKWGTGPK
jgi:hypothetical protein